MNILYLTNHLNIGGISSYVFTLARGMQKRGHRVYLASSEGELAPKFMAEGGVYFYLPLNTKSEISYKVFLSKHRLLKIIRDNRIDILHANTRVTQVLSRLIQRSCGIAYISTAHGFFKKRFFRRIFPCWGNKAIAISESVKEHLVKDFGVKAEDIRVIHSGIDVKDFPSPTAESQRQARRKLGFGEDPVVGIVARLSAEKGHTQLIRAMESVSAHIPKARLLIVGDGKMKEALMKVAQDAGVVGNVFFLPSVKDTKEVLAAMDIFILPSLKEGLGLSLMEAMASGLAVIGSNVGGIKSLIQDGTNGLLVEPGSVEGLSHAILYLLENPVKAESLGHEARGFIEKNFSTQDMVEQTERVYRECLGVKD